MLLVPKEFFYYVKPIYIKIKCVNILSFKLIYYYWEHIFDFLYEEMYIINLFILFL